MLDDRVDASWRQQPRWRHGLWKPPGWDELRAWGNWLNDFDVAQCRGPVAVQWVTDHRRQSGCWERTDDPLRAASGLGYCASQRGDEHAESKDIAHGCLWAGKLETYGLRKKKTAKRFCLAVINEPTLALVSSELHVLGGVAGAFRVEVGVVRRVASQVDFLAAGSSPLRATERDEFLAGLGYMR